MDYFDPPHQMYNHFYNMKNIFLQTSSRIFLPLFHKVLISLNLNNYQKHIEICEQYGNHMPTTHSGEGVWFTHTAATHDWLHGRTHTHFEKHV